MATYSYFLRLEVVLAREHGMGTKAVAESFGVSTAWVRRLLQRQRELGSFGALKGRRGRKPKYSGMRLLRLRELVAEQPDATLKELLDRSGVSCSQTTVFNTLKRLGYRRKKGVSPRQGRIVRVIRGKVRRCDK